MINIYITEQAIEQCYEQTADMLEEAGMWAGHDEICRAVLPAIEQCIIDAKIEHGLRNGRIITPCGKVYKVKNGWIDF